MSESEYVCEFCRRTDAKWIYLTAPFDLEGVNLESQTDNEWGACDPCANLVDKHDVEGLFQRTDRSFIERAHAWGMQVTGGDEKGVSRRIHEAYRDVQMLFFQNVISERMDVADYEELKDLSDEELASEITRIEGRLAEAKLAGVLPEQMLYLEKGEMPPGVHPGSRFGTQGGKRAFFSPVGVDFDTLDVHRLRRRVRSAMTMIGEPLRDKPEAIPESARAKRQAPWSEALALQVSLRDWWRSSEGLRYSEGFAKSMGLGPDFFIYDIEFKRLGTPNAYWVHNDMITVAEEAASRLIEYPLNAADLPTREGFCVLDRPIYTLDRHLRWMNIKAFSWGPAAHKGQDALLLAFYSDATVEDDFSRVNVALPSGQRLVLSYMTPWVFGAGAEGSTKFIDGRNAPQSVVDAGRDLFRLVQSFFLLCQQPISANTKMRPDRPMRRRFERKNQPVPDISVITLRPRRTRYVENEGDGKQVEWSHRWIVGGHWAHRHTKDGLKLVYIHDFVKGPEDKPLVVKSKIHRWVR